MRKFLATIALIIIMIGTFAPVSFSLSQMSNENSRTGKTISGIHLQEAFAQVPTTPSDDEPPEEDPDYCSSWKDFGCLIITGIVQWILIPIPSFLAALIGTTADMFLKFSINPAVYGTCGATGCDAVATAIRVGWGIVRDFANIGFIFALFVAAFMLILDKTSVGGKQFEPKKVVVRVIMMALLVNFSLFFCRMIIQTADIFSHLLYNRMGSTSITGSNPTALLSNALTSAGVKSPSLYLVAKVNPQELLTTTEFKADGGTTAYVILSLLSFFLYFMFIFMFAQMIFIFGGRIFALWLGMILAPFAFVSHAIPFLEDNPYIGFDNWLKNFTKLAFMTPLYLFFLYLTLSILQVNVAETALSSMSTLSTAGDWVVRLIYMVLGKLIPLFASVFILMYGKKWAVEMSGVVGEMAGKISGAVTGVAVGAVTGGAAFVGRQTVGALGSKLAAGTADSTGTFGKGLNTLGKGLSTSTFDVRNSAVFSKGMEYTGRATGQKMDIGANNLQEKGGHAATGGISQILEDRRERIADKKATEKEQEALERANNPQSRENIKKRNTERALKQAQQAKAAEEAKIAAEAEKAVVDTEKERTKLEEANAKADTTITENNDKIADIDTKLANKKLLSDDEMAQNTIDKEAAETIAKAIVTEEKELNDKIAANTAKQANPSSAAEATRLQSEMDALTKQKTDLEKRKTDNQDKLDDAVAKETEQKQITDLTSEKEKLESTNAKKEEEKAVNNAKLAALDDIKGKTAAQVKDEAEIKKAEAEGSKEKADLDKATKDADEEAKKVAELQEKIKKAEKEKDIRLAEELKKELNGDNWQEIEDLEDRIKKANTKEAKAKLKKELADIEVGGKQKKLNKARGEAITAKATYENVHGKQIKALEDLAKDTEKAYKNTDENKARVAVFTKRENDLKVELVKDTIAVNNMRKKILGAHADALDKTISRDRVDGHGMYSGMTNAANTVVGAVAPVLGVITNGRVGGGYVNNANNVAANNVRNNARTGGTTPPPAS